LDLDRLFSALERGGQLGNNGFSPVLLVASARQAKEAFVFAQQLRREGISVIEETMKNTQKSPLTWAVGEAKRQGIPRVVMYEPKKGPLESLLLLECSDSSLKPRQSRVALQELPQRLRAEIHGHF
jgi:histidyl-tRNA synthetase